jgi:hypothetical protein
MCGGGTFPPEKVVPTTIDLSGHGQSLKKVRNKSPKSLVVPCAFCRSDEKTIQSDRRRRWECLSMAKNQRNDDSSISWERVRAIFGNAQPPKVIWEEQFDFFDEDLRRIAATPFQEIDGADLWYYFHDLTYQDLQPDLFQYLFPVCLMDWHKTLSRNESCSHGDAEFHRAISHGDILNKRLTSDQRDEVMAFFRDSFLVRLDDERGIEKSDSSTSAYGWISRFNSLATVMPQIEMIWSPWWSVATPGRAVCLLQYCSGLIYDSCDNPLFDPWTRERGGGGPYLWENDSFIFDRGWMEPNIDFLRRTLTLDYVIDRITRAADRLQSEPEYELAQKVVEAAMNRRKILELRIEELPRRLENTNTTDLNGWAV